MVTFENWSWLRRPPSEPGRCQFQGYTLFLRGVPRPV